MKVVLTVWENRISPVADLTRQLLVVDVENGIVCNRRTEFFDVESVFYRARRLSDFGVEILICGAISDFFAGLLQGYGIQLISFICGEAEEVLNAYLEDSLNCRKFMVTGCPK
ncbi:MAG: dinitrogenase iron-molybdenum cofactor biosynthesis domain-containing protein [Deltaproteobacteria bacterium]|nr:dinitrogenase iron-molybdenum cofactor biosynthesis domain-containing protein [Deltaproteobacteria bacterium]